MSERRMRRARERWIGDERRRSTRLAMRAGTTATAALGATVLFAPAAQADTFQVTSTDDELDPSPTDVECDADCTLREALYEANEDSDGPDTITFASNVTGTITVDNSYDQFYAEEEVTIQGPGANVLEISGGGDRRIFYVNPNTEGDVGEPVTISGLTLADGTTDGSPGVDGGAINALYTELTLSEMVVRDSSAENFGGGVKGEYSSISVLSSAMTGNYAGGGNGDGGAIYRDNNPYGPEVISNSVFTDNYGTADGGALTFYDSFYSPLTIENTTVANNGAGRSGGGIKIFDAGEDAPITIRNSTVSGNESDGPGGGLSVGIFEDGVENASLSIENTTVSDNHAETYGGGIHVYGDEPSTARIVNSTVVDNTAGRDGGGVYLYNETTATTISSTIVSGNAADDEGDELFATGDGEFGLGFSLVEGNTGGPVTESPAGSNIFGQDPQLGPLANNGGPTQTHLPTATSPVIDAGIANGLANDQRGQPRTFDAAAVDNAAGSDGTDIGSVELQPGEGGLPGNAECKGVTVQKIVGTPGDDTLTGTDDRELITGRGGDDAIRALDGKDCANGNSGNDNVHGGRESDQVKGGGGRDRAKGGGDGDRVKGQAGKDRVGGGGGDDKVTGGAGKDRVKGGGGVDKLKGQGGKDRLKAVDGTQDKVNCGGGKDRATVDKKDRVSDNCEKVVEKV